MSLAPTETPSPIPTTPSTNPHQPPDRIGADTRLLTITKSAVSCSRSPRLPSLHQPDSNDDRTQRLDHPTRNRVRFSYPLVRPQSGHSSYS